jgi:hypothetical protein
MTTIIEDKIYELVTKKENFEFALDIHTHFDSIKERLIEEFWDLLILNFKTINSNFLITTTVINYFEISIKNIPNILFYFNIDGNKFQYGFGVIHKGTKKTIEEINYKFEGILDLTEFEKEEKTSWFYVEVEEKFNELFGLKKILPENRNILIDKYIQDFDKMVQSVQKTMELQ